MKNNYHKIEARRIKKELDNLSPEFAENGIVKTILRIRINQELKRSKNMEQKD